jgi:hypothetical protein
MRIVACAVLAAALGLSSVGAASADTPAEAKRIVRAWSTRLNAYDNAGVARLFAHPATFVQAGLAFRLQTAADIALWHQLLPCAGRVVSITVKGDRATAVFLLANGRNRRCDASGQKAAAVFRIRGGKIRTWTQIPVPPSGPEA